MFRIHRKQQKCASKSSLNICVVKIIQGGGVAAPIASQVLGEVLPYLEIEKDEEQKPVVEMPGVTGLSLSEAKKILEEAGLNYKIEGEAGSDTIITDQLPKTGIEIVEGTEVVLYVE